MVRSEGGEGQVLDWQSVNLLEHNLPKDIEAVRWNDAILIIFLIAVYFDYYVMWTISGRVATLTDYFVLPSSLSVRTYLCYICNVYIFLYNYSSLRRKVEISQNEVEIDGSKIFYQVNVRFFNIFSFNQRQI